MRVAKATRITARRKKSRNEASGGRLYRDMLENLRRDLRREQELASTALELYARLIYGKADEIEK